MNRCVLDSLLRCYWLDAVRPELVTGEFKVVSMESIGAEAGDRREVISCNLSGACGI